MILAKKKKKKENKRKEYSCFIYDFRLFFPPCLCTFIKWKPAWKQTLRRKDELVYVGLMQASIKTEWNSV